MFVEFIQLIDVSRRGSVLGAVAGIVSVGSSSVAQAINNPALVSLGGPGVAAAGSPVLCLGTAVFDWAGDQPDDLALQAGDPGIMFHCIYLFVIGFCYMYSFYCASTVQLLQKNADGWYRGRCRGKMGNFPANYCQFPEPYGDGSSVSIAIPVSGPVGGSEMQLTACDKRCKVLILFTCLTLISIIKENT